VAQACNPNHLRCGDWEDHSLRPAWAISSRDQSQPVTGCGGSHLSSLVIQESTNIKTAVQPSLGIKGDPISKNNQHKKGWGSDISGSVPA
jgi:hypothetical protein